MNDSSKTQDVFQSILPEQKPQRIKGVLLVAAFVALVLLVSYFGLDAA